MHLSQDLLLLKKVLFFGKETKQNLATEPHRIFVLFSIYDSVLGKVFSTCESYSIYSYHTFFLLSYCFPKELAQSLPDTGSREEEPLSWSEITTSIQVSIFTTGNKSREIHITDISCFPITTTCSQRNMYYRLRIKMTKNKDDKKSNCNYS